MVRRDARGTDGGIADAAEGGHLAGGRRLGARGAARVSGIQVRNCRRGTVEYKGKGVKGLNLPEPILRKIYNENPVKWFQGILASGAVAIEDVGRPKGWAEESGSSLLWHLPTGEPRSYCFQQWSRRAAGCRSGADNKALEGKARSRVVLVYSNV